MTGPLGTRLTRFVVGTAALLAAGTVATGCAASAGDLARTSCAHVTSSITLYDRATRATDQAEATRLKGLAYIELLSAIPIAAQAAYHDIQWEALSTTLSEASRVPEPVLVPALQSECQNADNSVFNQTPPPSSPTST